MLSPKMMLFVVSAVSLVVVEGRELRVRARHDMRKRTLEELRFNKCPPIIDPKVTSTLSRYQNSSDYPNGVHARIYPLMPEDYPVSGETAMILKTETRADAVVLPDDFALQGHTAEDYLPYLREPCYPSSTHSCYWHELETVVDWQIGRRANDNPLKYTRWPDLWADWNMTQIALSVFGEYPSSLQQTLLERLYRGGIKLDHDIMPFRSMNDIVGTTFLIAMLNTWSFEAVAPISFLLKWKFGVPRPEEIAWLIARGEYTAADGVPEGLVAKIKSMNLQNATHFTAYPVGSPMHPSWPAMHSSGSTCAIWMSVIAKLNHTQYCEALRMDHAVAMARTASGVHYPMDNMDGLNLGIRILINKLPAFLATYYGANADKVRAKMEFLAFDWRAFNAYDCTIHGVPVGQRLESWYNSTWIDQEDNDLTVNGKP